MIIYLSGPMASCMDTYKEKFAAAEELCRSHGHVVINPAVLPVGLDPERYMPICMAMIDAADAIFMIDGDWIDSLGAKLEYQYAVYQGKTVILDEGGLACL